MEGVYADAQTYRPLRALLLADLFVKILAHAIGVTPEAIFGQVQKRPLSA